MISVQVTKDTFISESINCHLYHNRSAKKQIIFYLPSLQGEKRFRFFVVSPKKIIIKLNTETDSFWASSKRELVLTPIPGVEAYLEAVLGKWQITSNTALTFR